ncbi:senecionine N-oxygenase [Zygosaccharomyces mellis]|uniref:glutaminase n=1 Tax=Zygosaccharomyces mellis TaxID=42258 RepID=A0A4C2E854_9SACH|nr:senecionine N-oxygenase [Zygosaccharomyces mellis]
MTTGNTQDLQDNKVIGVLALQGAFIEHIQHLNCCIDQNGYNLNVVAVRTAEELNHCDALIIPGGESTSMSLIAQRTGMYKPLYEFVRNPSKAIWGTCAGLIYISKEVSNEKELLKPLELVEIKVKRNAFGRQAQSFIQDCDFSDFAPGLHDFPTVFIRAPVIEEILDPKRVKPLYTLDNGLIVAAIQDENILATSFHPELADDVRFHDWFIKRFVIKQ